MQSNGRNEVCPCGSGKKYKKCCLANLQPISDDTAWKQIHSMHLKLVRKLMEFVSRVYGPTGYDEAWTEFNLWVDEEPFDPGNPMHPMFGPWMFYHWIPDSAKTELSDEIPLEVTPAEFFLKKNRNKLEELEIEDLEENLRRPFSFYDVLECKPHAWVKVQDLLTEEYFTVIEKKGSQTIKSGDLLFGKVVTVRDVTMFDGLAPLIFPPIHKVTVIHERKSFLGKDGKINAATLREYDLAMLKIFWDIYETVTNPELPIITNTDGHLMVPHKMTFAINSIDEAFEALHSLDFNDTKKDLLANADLLNNGKLKSVEFPWLIKGNKKNRHWENTVLGYIRLENNKMIVEVNSKERSKKFLALLKKRMPNGWVLKSKVAEDIHSKLSKPRNIQESAAEDQKNKELNDRPEVKEYLAKMNECHWSNWLMTSLPALRGKTPVEAIKTKDGRQMVDALLTDFERSAELRPMPGQTVETFQKIRDRLGL